MNAPPADAIARLAEHWQVTADYLCGITDFPERLPPGMWVVDLDYVEALERLDGSHQHLGDQGAFAVPPRAQLMSSVEYQALARRLGPLIERQRGGK